MLDERSKEILSALYPDIKVRAIRFSQDVFKVLNQKIKITQGLRTFEEQSKLYSQGRTFVNGQFQVVDRKHVVTNAPAGFSIHNYGLAFDIAFQGDDPYLSKFTPKDFDYTWRKTGEIGQRNGFKWGFDWNGNGKIDGNDFDRPHFELTYGERVTDLREIFLISGLIGIYKRIDAVLQSA